MTDEPRWWINESWLLTGPDIQRVFTADAWALESWPPCPVCGTMITAEYVLTPDVEGGWTYQGTGQWTCVDGCHESAAQARSQDLSATSPASQRD